MSRPVATVSVDVDPVDLHLLGYGVRGLAPDPSIYTHALPRLVERFARAGIRATFFVVARDAESQSAALRELVKAGHEIASHTFTHPLALSSLPAAQWRHEVADSRTSLIAAIGAPVVGFRAPNFDLRRDHLRELSAAGYRYDASAYPTPLMLLARLMLAAQSANPGAVLRLAPFPFSWRRDPHDLEGLREFPLAVTPGLRLPVYHTTIYFSRYDTFERRLLGFAGRGESVSYVMHAVDALGLVEDRVDPRLARHPGMQLALAEKLARLDRTLATIAGAFETRTFAERLERTA